MPGLRACNTITIRDMFIVIDENVFLLTLQHKILLFEVEIFAVDICLYYVSSVWINSQVNTRPSFVHFSLLLPTD